MITTTIRIGRATSDALTTTTAFAVACLVGGTAYSVAFVTLSLYTSRALTYFDLARQYGAGRLVDALRNVCARTLLIAFSSDWLYPPAGSEEMAAALRTLGKNVELHVIDAPYGHDCFLLEEARQTPMIQAFLRRVHKNSPYAT